MEPKRLKLDKDLLGGSAPYLVLSLLDHADRYGYEIIRELAVRSENVFELKEGTLYPILHKLESKGFLTSYTAQAPTGRERKYYHITKKGRMELEEERRQWLLFRHAVEKVTGAPPAGGQPEGGGANALA